MGDFDEVRRQLSVLVSLGVPVLVKHETLRLMLEAFDAAQERSAAAEKERDQNLLISGDVTCVEIGRPGCGLCTLCTGLMHDDVWECANAGNIALGKPADQVTKFDTHCAALVMIGATLDRKTCWHWTREGTFEAAVKRRAAELQKGKYTPPGVGEWRCSECGQRNDDVVANPSWRFNALGWEHQCPGRSPQAGHAPAHREETK